jgi:ATP-dependent DNA ligase
MLAETAADVADALAPFQPAAFELKLDGARVQVRKSGDDVRIYTHRLNEATERIPELVEAVRALPAKEMILDGESIARERWSPTPVSGDHEAVRTKARRGYDALRASSTNVLLRLPAPRR